MRTYTVKEVAKMLDTNPETVRRWIRSGRLEAEQESRKEGNVISEQMLKRFLKDSPKYAGFLAAANPTAGLTVLSVSLIGSLIANQIGKRESNENIKISNSEMIRLLSQDMKKRKSSIREKKETIRKLKEEIEQEEELINQTHELIAEIKSCSERKDASNN